MGNLIGMAFNWGSSLVTGLSLKTWLRIGAVAAVALLVWLAYCWAWDRGAASKQADLDREKAKVDILVDDIERLTKAINERNDTIEADAERAREASAAAAAQASDDLAAVDKAKASEETRGAGAANLNRFFDEIFGQQ